MANVDAWNPLYSDTLMQVMAQAISRKNSGYYVISGCDVHENSPTAMNVIVDAGTIVWNGTYKSYAGGTVSVTSDATYPKMYVIYLDSTPTGQGYAGAAASILPAGETEFRKMEQPKPGDSCPSGVMLSIVYVPAGATSINNSNILDIAQYGNNVVAQSVTFSDTKKLLGRKSASGGVGEEVTVSDALDMVGSTARGDLVSRGASTWNRLAVGTYGQILKSDGVDPVWGTLSGGINYITNYDAGADTTGWATYADAAASDPVDGTGGSPNITWTRSTSNPLRGTANFLLTKDAANRLGEGVSYDFTIDRSDATSMLRISFDWESNVTLSEGDITIYIYDKDNSKLIQTIPYKLPGTVANQQNHWVGEFQTSALPANDYRLIIHIASTSTTAWAIKFDNFAIGPNPHVQGVPITDPESKTMTLSNISGTVTSKFTRVGKLLFIDFTASITGGASGNITLNLPAGYNVDSTAISHVSPRCGFAQAYDVTGNSYVGIVELMYPTTNSFVFRSDNNTITEMWDADEPFIWSNGDYILGTIIVPIVGWSSNCQVSSDADTRVIAFSAYKNGDQSLSNSVETKLTSFTPTIDTHGGWDSTNNRYIVKVPGIYVIGMRGYIAPHSSTSERILLYTINGGSTIRLVQMPNCANTSTHPNGSAVVSLSAGDYIEFYALQSSGTSLNYVSSSMNTISVYRLSGPSQIAASEKIATTAELSGTINLAPNGSAVKVNLNTTTLDTHGCFNTGTYKWTCPRAGYYHVDFAVSLRNTNVLNSRYYTSLYKNGAELRRGNDITPSANTYLCLVGSGVLYLLAGDYLELYLYGAGNNSTNQLVAEYGGGGCYLSVSSI